MTGSSTPTSLEGKALLSVNAPSTTLSTGPEHHTVLVLSAWPRRHLPAYLEVRSPRMLRHREKGQKAAKERRADVRVCFEIN